MAVKPLEAGSQIDRAIGPGQGRQSQAGDELEGKSHEAAPRDQERRMEAKGVPNRSLGRRTSLPDQSQSWRIGVKAA
jgi:hypothetical protein